VTTGLEISMDETKYGDFEKGYWDYKEYL